jgi:hypothetical protein
MFAGGNWLLLFAHPGHELRAHHLMERTQPLVGVLTDGSGSTGVSRLDETRSLLDRVGARPAPVFGALSDREAYAALMDTDAEPFVVLVEQIVYTLCGEAITAILVDSAEGYNPIHDICHWIGRAAIAKAQLKGARIDLFELDVVSHPDGAGGGLRLVLDDQAFARKLGAVDRYQALASETKTGFQQHGTDAFRVEFLRRVVDGPAPPESEVPYYEEVGEARVREGRYGSVLRYAQHVRPVIEKLLELGGEAPYGRAFRTLHQ